MNRVTHGHRPGRLPGVVATICVACAAVVMLTGCLAVGPPSDNAGNWRIHLARLGTAPIQDPYDDTPDSQSVNTGEVQSRRNETVARVRRTWHIDLGLRTSHTKLGSTEQQLDRRLDLPLKTDILGIFHRPDTPIDRKTNLGLNSAYLGIGRDESDKLTWTWYFAGGTGEDRSDQRWLHLRLKVNFKYGTYLTGFATEYYPWGRPNYAGLRTWTNRFQSSRPYVYTGIEGGYISGQGKGEYTVFGRSLYKDGVSIRDWVLGFPVGLGWRIPLTEQWSFALAGGYIFHVYRPNEYNGWNVLTGLRYRF